MLLPVVVDFVALVLLLLADFGSAAGLTSEGTDKNRVPGKIDGRTARF